MQGFCFQPPLQFTAGVRSDVLFSDTFPPSSDETGIDFKGWSKLDAVRGDLFAGAFTLQHANAHQQHNDHHLDQHRRGCVVLPDRSLR